MLAPLEAVPEALARWQGHRLLAFDSSLLQLSASAEVWAYFGGQEAANQGGPCGVRVPPTGPAPAEGLGVLHAGDLVLLDRGYAGYEFFAQITARGAHFAGRCPPRGFASRANRRFLEEKDILDATCPRDPAELTRRHRQDELFAACQRRRAQTEARVGILKNNFLGGQPRARGYERRAAAVDWAVLAHNLRVIARLPRAKAKPDTAQDPPEVRAAA